MKVPSRFAAFGRDHTHSTHVLANEAVVPFTIKLLISQHAGDGGEVSRLLQQVREERLSVTRT